VTGLARQTLLEALAREYPRMPNEGSIHYAQRLNVLAGFLPREEASLLGADEDLEVRGPGEPLRLPYKED